MANGFPFFAKRIVQLRQAPNFHDYAYILNNSGVQIAKELQAGATAPPDLQKAIREKFSVKSDCKKANFHVKNQEAVNLNIFIRGKGANGGVQINKQTGKKGLLRVLVIFQDTTQDSREIEIPILLLEEHAESYLSDHSLEELDIQKLLSFAINAAAVEIMVKAFGPMLYRAIEAGQESFVRELLTNGHDANELAEYEWTPLLIACAQGYPRIVEMLLDAGANPDIANINRITPLMYTARYGNTKICELLLEFRAALDKQDVYGMTVLMVASSNSHLPIIELLLDAGADQTVTTREGLTALDFAHKYGHGQIAKRLRQAQDQ